MTNLNNTTATKPTYTLSYWDNTYGKFINGIYHAPLFAILRNGEPLLVMGSTLAYQYSEASHILMHLQAVSNDTFTLEVVSYKPMTDYNVILDSDTQKRIIDLLDDPFHPVNKGGEHG